MEQLLAGIPQPFPGTYVITTIDAPGHNNYDPNSLFMVKYRTKKYTLNTINHFLTIEGGKEINNLDVSSVTLNFNNIVMLQPLVVRPNLRHALLFGGAPLINLNNLNNNGILYDITIQFLEGHYTIKILKFTNILDSVTAYVEENGITQEDFTNRFSLPNGSVNYNELTYLFHEAYGKVWMEDNAFETDINCDAAVNPLMSFIMNRYLHLNAIVPGNVLIDVNGLPIDNAAVAGAAAAGGGGGNLERGVLNFGEIARDLLAAAGVDPNQQGGRRTKHARRRTHKRRVTRKKRTTKKRSHRK